MNKLEKFMNGHKKSGLVTIISFEALVSPYYNNRTKPALYTIIFFSLL